MTPASKTEEPIDEAERQRRIAALRRDLDTLPIKERFTRIDDLEIYRGSLSRSGHASDPDETRSLRRWLPDLAARLNAWRVLDAPCGDCLWMARIDFLGADYFGVDIVPALIERNRELHGDRATFLCLDVTGDLPPDTDLIVCRDLLIHLSFADALNVLRRFCETEARWLVTTTYPEHMVNSDIPSGEFYAVNLEREPFCLPPPLEVHLEGSTLGDGEFRDKAMALWSLRDVRRRLEEIDRAAAIHKEYLKSLAQAEEPEDRTLERADPYGHGDEEGAHADE